MSEKVFALSKALWSKWSFTAGTTCGDHPVTQSSQVWIPLPPSSLPPEGVLLIIIYNNNSSSRTED